MEAYLATPNLPRTAPHRLAADGYDSARKPPVARRWKPTSRTTTAWQRMATIQPVSRSHPSPVATCRQTVEAYLATPNHRLAADGYMGW